MIRLDRFIRFHVSRGGLPRLILAALPLILAACTNGGGGGPGY
jgi:hypothetical protein